MGITKPRAIGQRSIPNLTERGNIRYLFAGTREECEKERLWASRTLCSCCHHCRRLKLVLKKETGRFGPKNSITGEPTSWLLLEEQSLKLWASLVATLAEGAIVGIQQACVAACGSRWSKEEDEQKGRWAYVAAASRVGRPARRRRNTWERESRREMNTTARFAWFHGLLLAQNASERERSGTRGRQSDEEEEIGGGGGGIDGAKRVRGKEMPRVWDILFF